MQVLQNGCVGLIHGLLFDNRHAFIRSYKGVHEYAKFRWQTSAQFSTNTWTGIQISRYTEFKSALTEFKLVKNWPKTSVLDFLGIFFTDGALWHDQRRFMLRHLRDFGFGRRFEELELEINEELVQFVDFLRHGPKYDFEKVGFCKPSENHPNMSIVYHFAPRTEISRWQKSVGSERLFGAS